jgi:hypothetical protein
MQIVNNTRAVRNTIVLIVAAAVLFLATGCSTFRHDWKMAGKTPPPRDDITGQWRGFWKSNANGHNDALQCVVTKNAEGKYKARFHAKYKKVLTFGYTVPLQVTQTNNTFQFQGDANLGWWAGGVYHYEGHATPTNFFSTYRCKYDRGIFEMSRPTEARP